MCGSDGQHHGQYQKRRGGIGEPSWVHNFVPERPPIAGKNVVEYVGGFVLHSEIILTPEGSPNRPAFRGQRPGRVFRMTELAETSIADDADEAALRSARELLSAAGYTEANVCRILGVDTIPSPRARRREDGRFLDRLADDSPLDQFIRIFLFYRPVKTPLFDPHTLANAGLLRTEDDGWVPNVDLLPFRDLLLASDLPDRGLDQVMGVAASTRALAQFAIRRTRGDVLDLGTGCGVHALTAAKVGASVAAVDVNPRAVKISRFNARLNGVEDIEFAAGNLFDPVEGRRFDLILFNPPFVIGPAVAAMHTSSGETGDHFCERVLREVPEYLEEGGFAQILCNWVERESETGQERVSRWLERSGCDAWVLRSHLEDADEYARARASEIADTGPVEPLFERWREHLRAAEITGINFGLVTMRRTSRPRNWLRYEEIPGASGYCGRSIEAGFALHDYLVEHAPDELLDAPLTHARGIEVSEISEKKRKLRLRLNEGLTITVTADPEIAKLVQDCSGKTTLRDLARKLAARRHVPVSYVLPALVTVAKPLIEYGFLLPVEIASKLDR
jgi:HemK-related putative methylase